MSNSVLKLKTQHLSNSTFTDFLCGLQVEEELLEQEFLERCFQEMLEEEDQDWFIPSRDLNNQGVGQLQQQLNGLSVSDHHSNLEEVAVSQRHVTTRLDSSTSCRQSVRRDLERDDDSDIFNISDIDICGTLIILK